uniref:Candidate secreted effector n=1 Tax=Meloidogyne incognita TaxID=6306 RepID=A0A914NMZ3_MELIC
MSSGFKGCASPIVPSGFLIFKPSQTSTNISLGISITVSIKSPSIKPDAASVRLSLKKLL